RPPTPCWPARPTASPRSPPAAASTTPATFPSSSAAFTAAPPARTGRGNGGDAPRNVPNEITIYTYTTKTTKRLFSGRFVFFVGFVGFVIPLGERGIVISLISLKSWFSGGTVES